MSKDSVTHGIIEKRKLVDFIEVLHSKPSGVKSALVSEARLHFDGDGITTRAVDSANVATVLPAHLAARGFEVYDAPSRVTVGVDLGAIIDKLKPASADTLVEFDVDMETRKLHLHYGNTDMTVAMIDPEAIRSEPDRPDLELPNTVTVAGSDLSHAAEVSDMVSDHCAVECDPDAREVRFYGEGDVDEASVTLSDEDLLDPTKVSEETESLYSVDYFRTLFKPIPDDAEVTIQVGDEFPIMFDWGDYDGALSVHQMLAPRIQSR